MANALTLTETPGLGKLLIESRFRVQSHQRNYAWETRHVKQLITDLVEAIERGDQFYFVGLMVFMVADDGRLVVLDGQQRLATTVILMSAIRAWLAPMEKHSKDAHMIGDDFIGRSDFGESEILPKLSLNYYNDQVFQDFAVAGKPLSEARKVLKGYPRHNPNINLLNAIIHCHEWVESIAGSKGDTETAAKYLLNLVKYARDSVVVVRLVVPSEASAYRVFETLNDRGLDLTAMDLVKNHLFARAEMHSKTWLADMEQRWAQMMQNLQNAKADDFLKVFWTSQHGRIQTENLYSEIRKSSDNAKDAVNLAVDLLSASERYIALDNADDAAWASYPESVSESLQSLKTLGSKQMRPVVLAAMQKMEPREVERLLRLLETVLVRYQLIGGGRTGRLEISSAKLARAIFSGVVTTATQARESLSDVYPSDDEFKAAFALKQETTGLKQKYILRKIERELRRREDGAMTGQLEAPTTLTVEHILPRGAEKNEDKAWVSVIDADPKIVEECVDRLGNLCLLPKINKDLANSGFEFKRPFYEDSDLIITKEVAGYPQWNRAEIQRRQERMAKIAVAAWSFN